MIDITIFVSSLAAVAVLTAVIVWLIGRKRTGSVDVSPLAEKVDTALARLEGEVTGRVKSLDERITQIATVFTNDRARGTWGEVTLQNLLAHAGLTEGRDYLLQDTGGNGRPDATVLLPGDRKLVIDAKFPIARLVDALSVDDSDERSRLLAEHAKEIDKIAKELIDRGYARDAAGGFVVLYLPHEAVFQAAMGADPDLFERLIARRIVVAGPSTLLAVLRAAAQLLVEQRAVAEAREIVDDAKELHHRLVTFVGHFAKIGKNLNGATDAYNKAVGSWTSRVSVQVDRLANRADLPAVTAPVAVDSSPRPAPELEQAG